MSYIFNVFSVKFLFCFTYIFSPPLNQNTQPWENYVINKVCFHLLVFVKQVTHAKSIILSSLTPFVDSYLPRETCEINARVYVRLCISMCTKCGWKSKVQKK